MNALNVMNSKNIDHRLQSKLNSAVSIKMGEEKKIAIQREEPGNAEFKKVSSPGMEGKKIKRKRKSPLIPWKKPEGMPKRPLSAYNLFFQDRRKSIMLAASESSDEILEDSKHRKPTKKRSGVGFANLARTIGTEWKALDPEKKAPYELLAANDKNRYDKEMKVWRAKEKEEKLLRESNSASKASSYDCVTGMPTYTAISLARKGLGEDAHLMRNKTVDGSIPLTDMIGGIGTRDQSVDMLQPLYDQESRGVFHSSIYNNYNNTPYSLDTTTSSDGAPIVTLQQREDPSVYSPTSPFMASKRHLTQLNDSIIKEQLEQSSIIRDSYPYNISTISAAGRTQVTQSPQYQNHLYISTGGTVNRNIGGNVPKTMPWSNPRNALNVDNITAGSIDLEPLPLPDNNLQPHQQRLYQESMRERQIGWSSQHHGLQQLHAKDQQQQRITIASNAEYLPRLPTGGASLLSTGWGQNTNSWLEKSAANLNANESIRIPSGNGDMIATNTVSQNVESDPKDNERSSNSTRTFPSNSTNSNQDPWKPLGFFNEDSR